LDSSLFDDSPVAGKKLDAWNGGVIHVIGENLDGFYASVADGLKEKQVIAIQGYLLEVIGGGVCQRFVNH
jgi:hypothetical protein